MARREADERIKELRRINETARKERMEAGAWSRERLENWP